MMTLDRCSCASRISVASTPARLLGGNRFGTPIYAATRAKGKGLMVFDRFDRPNLDGTRDTSEACTTGGIAEAVQ